jgi:NTP pyrophosphatase (non-canonical NTP hydrolase)
MTIQEAQHKVDKWIMEYGGGYFSELTNLGILTEEVGEMARWIVRLYGDQTPKPSEQKKDMHLSMADEMADILWVLICLANQTKIDLEAELIKNLEKKTLRDSKRHIHKDLQGDS